MIERHVLVGTPRLLDQPLDFLLDRMPALHVLHNDARLDLWPNWLAKADMPARYAENGIEFSTLEQAIRAATKGAGLAIVDRNMIVDELASDSLAQFSEIEVTGPFGYWLDNSTAARRPGTRAGARGLDARGSAEDERSEHGAAVIHNAGVLGTASGPRE
ncbi:MAG: Putative LysR-family transcriptional regulator [uncultured Paraburkholderia sp.]|nr:MAG: Putative LysR-family transcriptional regulator [uncultured Paraburkholderia sp.]CAH2936841.1 MAG: Putative LysR-family transcriptional regulator [uncultured Paraburkholderia sp.]